MSESQSPPESAELGDLFVSVTGDEQVTERQEETASKEPLDEDERFQGYEDGLKDAVDADLDSE